jgi:hypothetical protein
MDMTLTFVPKWAKEGEVLSLDKMFVMMLQKRILGQSLK